MIENSAKDIFYMQYTDNGMRNPFMLNEKANYFWIEEPLPYETSLDYFSKRSSFLLLIIGPTLLKYIGNIFCGVFFPVKIDILINLATNMKLSFSERKFEDF